MSQTTNILSSPVLSQEDKEALLEYKKSIAFLASEKLNLEFNNKDQFHATAVMSEIFKTAQSSIRIFAGSFSGEVSNDELYVESLRNAIDTKAINIEVIFENKPNANSRCLAVLKELKANGKNVQLYVLKADYLEKVKTKYKIELAHFTIGDDQMFRYETDKINFRAFCNFDDKTKASALTKNFAILKLNSTSLV